MEEEERKREQQRRQMEEEQRRIAAELAREQAKSGWGAGPTIAKSPVSDGTRVKSLLEIQKEEAKKQSAEPKKDKKVRGRFEHAVKGNETNSLVVFFSLYAEIHYNYNSLQFI